MKASIIYSTNTGNTYLVAQIIRDLLTSNHQLNFSPAQETSPDTIKDSQAIIIGSSSWDWQGKEGHPLHTMKDFLSSIESISLADKKIAVFGCGDKDFRIFCGAVDHIEDHITSHQGSLVVPSLRIDKFYIDILHKIELVKAWAKDLDKKLQ